MTTILLKNAHHKKVKVQPTFTQVISGQRDQEWFYSFVYSSVLPDFSIVSLSYYGLSLH